MSGNRCYKYEDDYFEHDELRARFTAWLDTVVYRAKLKYLRKKDREAATVSIDEVPEQYLGWYEQSYDSYNAHKIDFEFEEEKLAQAFSMLPLMRKEVLRLLFVEEKDPAEIADRLNCSVQHVYNQRSLAIKKLRQLFNEDGDGR